MVPSTLLPKWWYGLRYCPSDGTVYVTVQVMVRSTLLPKWRYRLRYCPSDGTVYVTAQVTVPSTSLPKWRYRLRYCPGDWTVYVTAQVTVPSTLQPKWRYRLRYYPSVHMWGLKPCNCSNVITQASNYIFYNYWIKTLIYKMLTQKQKTVFKKNIALCDNVY